MKRFLQPVAFGAAVFAVGLLAVPVFPVARAQNPASLYVGSSGGTFTVGSTFTMSVVVNTGGNDVNAIDASLRFPPDKLQVVSPTAGKSLVQIWISQPSYDNSEGLLRFQGAIPSPGINTSAGVVSQVTFRVTGLGTALVRFMDDSKVLLNDGKGTNILGQMTSGLYHLELPPPAGPIVTSPTHSDQEKWYSVSTVGFEWDGSGESNVQGYSYVLSDEPVDTPDDIVDGNKENQVYKSVPDGIHYFHIKALRKDVWGGVTHFAVRIDTSPPADFPIEVTPSARTVVLRPAIAFNTTDAYSGIDHYEIRVVPLTPGAGTDSDAGDEQQFFFEATSPHVPELKPGNYDVVVRAYDRAGNFLQKTARLEIITNIFEVIGDQGIQLKSNIIIPWVLIYIVAGLIIVILGFLARHYWHRHRLATRAVQSSALPPDVERQLAELKTLKERYGQMTAFLLLSAVALSFLVGAPAHAVEAVEVAPPIIEVVSRNISNEDIMYVGGASEASGSEITLYIQNTQDGQTLSQKLVASGSGEWFYSHPTFLSSGRYLVWAEAKVGSVKSPPSPQVEVTVSPTALQFGSSRVSYEVVYLTIALGLFVIVLMLVGIILYYRRRVRAKHAHIAGEVRKAEESIRRGFALLHRDIEAEFKLMQNAKATRGLTPEEQALEQKVRRDLDAVRRYIGEEIWEIERNT